MRALFYAVLNTKTNKRIYKSIDRWRCEKKIEQFENKEDYTIISKFSSI